MLTAHSLRRGGGAHEELARCAAPGTHYARSVASKHSQFGNVRVPRPYVLLLEVFQLGVDVEAVHLRRHGSSLMNDERATAPAAKRGAGTPRAAPNRTGADANRRTASVSARLRNLPDVRADTLWVGEMVATDHSNCAKLYRPGEV